MGGRENHHTIQNEAELDKYKHAHSCQERVFIAKSLFGIIPDNITLEEAQEERLKRV